jgi:hypothetical protein
MRFKFYFNFFKFFWHIYMLRVDINIVYSRTLVSLAGGCAAGIFGFTGMNY